MKPPCWCSSVVHLWPCDTEIPLFCFCSARDENCLRLFDFLLRMRELCQHVVRVVFCHQPRSQALSPLSPFVVRRETLVEAGHITTQTQSGKKNLLGGRGGILWVLKPRAVATRCIGVPRRILPMKNASL